MLSLPLIVPRDDHSIWHYSSPHLRPNPPSPTNGPSSNQPLDNAAGGGAPHQHQQHRRGNQAPRSSALAALLHDENTIEQRKQNVRRFGAGWIRPPGIAKTYQAAMDEAAEREEQEILARREAAMMELANAQEQEEEEARRREMIQRGDGEEGEEGEEGEGDVDLDADVPDLDADVPDLDADVPEGSLGGASEDEEEDEEETEEEEDEEEEVTEEEEHTGEVTQDVTFNEESMYGDASLLGEEHDEDAENVQQWVEREEAEMAGDLQDERDLDDDIPEAGEYEHTDTELEDDLTEESLRNSGIDTSGLGSALRSNRSSRRSAARNVNFSGSGPFGGGSGGARQTAGVPAFNLNRRPPNASFLSDGPSSLLGDESSFLESSPNAGRGIGRGGPSWMQPPPRPNWRRG